MRNLYSWLKRTSGASAPAVLEPDFTDRPPPIKRLRGLRAPPDYRTDELIEEVRKYRVLWSREARGFHSPAARDAAYKLVAAAMNRRFPELRSWDEVEIEGTWRQAVQAKYACVTGHGVDGKPHGSFCRIKEMDFMAPGCRAFSGDWRAFIPRIYYRGSVYFPY